MNLAILSLLIYSSTNEKYKEASRSIAVMPLQCAHDNVAQHWWDEGTNGSLVLQKCALGKNGISLVDWSDTVNLDQVGTNGEIHCKKYIFNVSIDSLAGAFHRSNVISISPRFVVKNMLHIQISLVPIFGGKYDARRVASQLRFGQKHNGKIDLDPGQSTVLFHFHNESRGVEKEYRWIAFCVNAARFGGTFRHKVRILDLHATLPIS